MTEFGTRLRMLRLKNGILSKDMAALLTITPRNYQRYESGEVDPPTSKVMLLAEHFGVTADYLLGRSDYSYKIISTKTEQGNAYGISVFGPDGTNSVINNISQNLELTNIYRNTLELYSVSPVHAKEVILGLLEEL